MPLQGPAQIGGVLEMEYISKFPSSVPILLQEMGRGVAEGDVNVDSESAGEEGTVWLQKQERE